MLFYNDIAAKILKTIFAYCPTTMIYIINGRTYSNCDFKFFAFVMAVIKNDDVISYANISYLGW